MDIAELEGYVLDDSYYNTRRALIDGEVSLDNEEFLVDLAVIYDKAQSLQALFEYGSDPWNNIMHSYNLLSKNGCVYALEVCDKYMPHFLHDYIAKTNPVHDFIFSNSEKNRDSYELEDLMFFMEKKCGIDAVYQMLMPPFREHKQVLLMNDYIICLFKINWEPENYNLLISVLENIPKEYNEEVFRELLNCKSNLMLTTVLSSGLYAIDEKFYDSLVYAFFIDRSSLTVEDIARIDLIDRHVCAQGASYNYIFKTLNKKQNFNNLTKSYENISWALSNGFEVIDEFYNRLAVILLNKNDKMYGDDFLAKIFDDDRLSNDRVIGALVNYCATSKDVPLSKQKSLRNYLDNIFYLENSFSHKKIVEVLRKNISKISSFQDKFMNNKPFEVLDYLDTKGHQDGLLFILKNKFDINNIKLWIDNTIDKFECNKNSIFLFKNGSLFKTLSECNDNNVIDLDVLRSAIFNKNVLNFFINNQQKDLNEKNSLFEKLKSDIKDNSLENVILSSDMKNMILEYKTYGKDGELYASVEKFLLDLTLSCSTKKSIKNKI